VRRIYDIDEMLGKYKRGPRPGQGKLVALSGLDGLDGYNPSPPVANGSSPYVFVRMEPRNVEYDTWSVPFRQTSIDAWEAADDVPMFRIQDPFCAVVQGTLVVGGVRIVSRLGNAPLWETVFMRGSSLSDLAEFARSPAYMKDVRLLELEDGRVGIFTRPWGSATRFIGYTEIDALDQLTTAVLAEARLLESQPVEGQWWGANAVYNLGAGKLGVLAHIARWEGGNRHYYPIVFVFDRLSFSVVDGPKIIAERACFPAHDAKQPDLENVIFPAFIDRDRGLFFGGLSDTAIGVMPLEDPFADTKRGQGQDG
jgi:hypothetical protein